MTTLRQRLREQIERAVRQVLPERAVAVVWETEIPPSMRLPSAVGWTCHHLAVALRGSLGDRLRDRPAIVVLADRRLWRYTRRWTRFRWEAWQVVSHELAHIVAMPADEVEPPEAEVVAAVERACSEDREPVIRTPIPWRHHDAGFLRIAFHAAHRLRQVQWFGYGGVVEAEHYGLSSESRYRSALGDEPERLIDTPLTKLSSIAPPEPFAELWRADLRRWFLSISDPNEAQADAFVEGLRMFPSVFPPVLKGRSMTSLLEQVRTKFRARTRQKAGNYAALIRQVADGSAVAEAVVSELDLLDKTPDQLQHDVELFQRRQQLRETIDKLPDLDKESERLQSTMEKANEKLAGAEHAHAEVASIVSSRLEEIASLKTSAQNAESELRRTYPAEFGPETQEIDAELRQIGSQVTKVDRERRDAAAYARYKPGDLVGEVSESDRQRWLVAKKAAAEQLAAEQVSLESRRTELLTRLAAIDRQRLEIWPAE